MDACQRYVQECDYQQADNEAKYYSKMLVLNYIPAISYFIFIQNRVWEPGALKNFVVIQQIDYVIYKGMF